MEAHEIRAKRIRDFLDSKTSQEQLQRAWDRHLGKEGFKSGMLMCCCGCYGFGWGRAPENGIWYLPGHAPKSPTSAPQAARRSASRKAKKDNSIWVEIGKWILAGWLLSYLLPDITNWIASLLMNIK